MMAGREGHGEVARGGLGASQAGRQPLPGVQAHGAAGGAGGGSAAPNGSIGGGGHAGARAECVDSSVAASRDTSQPLLILAGPGSGKTQAFAQRVVHLIKQGVPPSSILGFTFTRAAAQEMKSRVKQMMTAQQMLSGEECKISTFHSFGLRVCRTFGDNKSFSVFGQRQCVGVIAEAMAELLQRQEEERSGGSGNSAEVSQSRAYSEKDIKAQAQRVQAFFSVEKSRTGGTNALLEHQAYGTVYRLYQERMSEYGAYDFNDLIINANNILAKPEVAEYFAREFIHVLVDEFQDVTDAQFTLLQRLSSHRRITVVGDDDQSIYGFAGANSGVCVQFSRAFRPIGRAQLGRNFRSHSTIVGACAELIRHNQNRMGKCVWSEMQSGEMVRIVECRTAACEASSVAACMRARHSSGKLWGSMAVLVRTRALVQEVKASLKQAGVPVGSGGRAGGEVYEEDEGSQVVLAWLRLVCCEGDDASCLSALRDPALALSEASVHAIRALARKDSVPLFRACRSLVSSRSSLFEESTPEPSQLREQDASRLRSAIRLIDVLLSKGKTGMPEELVLTVLTRSFGVGNGGRSQGEAQALDVQALPHALRSLVYSARNYEFENPNGDCQGSEKRKQPPTPQAEPSKRPCAASPAPSAARGGNAWASAAKGARLGHNDSMTKMRLTARPSHFPSPSPRAPGRSADSSGGSHASSIASPSPRTPGRPDLSQGSRAEPLTPISSNNPPPSARAQHSRTPYADSATPSAASQPPTVPRSALMPGALTPTSQMRGRASGLVRLRGFLEYLALSEVDGPSKAAKRGKAGAEADDGVVVTTVHQAKGLEWDSVFVCRVNEGTMPLECRVSRSLNAPDEEDHVEKHFEEERRLLYVAMSRAKKDLQLSFVITDPVTNLALEPSRFLKEIGTKFAEKSQQYVDSTSRSDGAGKGAGPAKKAVGAHFVSARSMPH